MVKVVKAKYLSTCDSCKKKCTYLIRAGRKYLHVCTSCLLELKQQLGGINESQKQVEQ